MTMASLARRPTVLIVLHQEHSTPGRIGARAQGHGGEARHSPAVPRRAAAGEARRPRRRHGVRRPDGRQRHARLGQARDRLARHAARRGEADSRRMPRGANAGARARRAGVQLRGQAQRDRLFPIEPTPAGERLCAARFPRSVYQWHSDGFDLPEGAELLAAAAGNSPTRPIAMAATRSVSSSTRKSPIT